MNDVLSDAALKLAFQSFLRGAEPEAAEVIADRARARAILLGYAERYRTMPTNPVLHPTHPGVVTWSGLDESVWIIRLTWAHALLGDSLSASDDRKIRDDLLRPAADHMRRIRWPEIHNVTNWNNAAIATLAIALDDSELARLCPGRTGRAERGARARRAPGRLLVGRIAQLPLLYVGRAHLDCPGSSGQRARVRRQGRPAPDAARPARDRFPGPDPTGHPRLLGRHRLDRQGRPRNSERRRVLRSRQRLVRRTRVRLDPRPELARHPRTPFEALLDGSLTIPAAPEPAFSSYHTDDSGLAVIRTRQPRERQTYLMLKAGQTPAITVTQIS